MNRGGTETCMMHEDLDWIWVSLRRGVTQLAALVDRGGDACFAGAERICREAIHEHDTDEVR